MPSPEAKATVTCAVPRNGRTLECFLASLAPLTGSSEQIAGILDVLALTKKASTNDFATAKAFLDQISEASPHFSICIDKKRDGRPFRVGFLSATFMIDGVPLRLEGEDPHNCSGTMHLGEFDMAVVGFDEMLTTLHDNRYFNNLTSPKWGDFNSYLPPYVQPRIAGSAGLRRSSGRHGDAPLDFVGMFLISRRKHDISVEGLEGEYPDAYLKSMARGRRVYVKDRYRPLAALMYPRLDLVPVTNVEDAVLACPEHQPGLEIVQSGSTVCSKDLVIHGNPVMVSETLYLVNYAKFLKDAELRKVVEALKPIGYFDEQRVSGFAAWVTALENKVGARWVRRPDIASMFCSQFDITRGVLRPYRLESRNWRPDDHREVQARILVDDALKLLESSYLGARGLHRAADNP